MASEVLVFTIKGLVPRDQLRAVDIVTEDENVRIIATEWWLGDEQVRRDVAISQLRPMEVSSGG